MMRVVCPQPACRQSFTADSADLDKRGHLHGYCPNCGQYASFRDEKAMQILFHGLEKKRLASVLQGGPERSPGYIPTKSAIVEDVRSLWNVGSIFRSSDGAGFEHLYLCGITGSPPRKEISKVSLGAEESVSWQYELNPLDTALSLKSRGVFLIAMESSQHSVPLVEFLECHKLETPVSIVVGNEVSGISPQLLQVCHVECNLPMRGSKESLNVAVAFGIAAYMIAGKLE